MSDNSITRIEQIETFLAGTEAVEFRFDTKNDGYEWIRTTLIRFTYTRLRPTQKGLLRRYLQRVTGYSRAQVTRLIGQYVNTGRVVLARRGSQGFKKWYTDADIRLLAHTDACHSTLSGLATKKILERQYLIYRDKQYARLATISVSHLYNLRRHTCYRNERQTVRKTHAVQRAIGERRKPRPQGQPGFLRVDSVHQGDLDGVKGVYHINAVDEITQWQVVATVEKISEAHLLPALKLMLNAFPFVIRNFHSDNGSEYINREVARLLNKLVIEFTKSRARHSNDNALAESKNGAVVRKQFGYAHIPQHFAQIMNEFNQQKLNPYLAYHRPCLFAETTINDKGKQKKTYRYSHVMTPWEKLKSLPHYEQFLKPDITPQQLDENAQRMSDNQAALELNQAKQILFKKIMNKNAA